MPVVQKQTAVRIQMSKLMAEATETAAQLEYEGKQEQHKLRCYLCSRPQGFGDVIEEASEIDDFAQLILKNKMFGESGWALAQGMSNYPIRSFR